MKDFCVYYQAHVVPEQCWFFVAVLRSFEHICFDRTYDVHKSIFEFFVPEDVETDFLELMKYFKQEHIIADLTKYPNRLLDPDAVV